MKPAGEVYSDGRELPEGVKAIVIAKDQPEYMPLAAVCLPGGEIATRWVMTEEERRLVAETGEIYLVVMTFGGDLQPVMVMADAPEIGVETNGPMFFYSRLATLEAAREARAKETRHHAPVDADSSSEDA